MPERNLPYPDFVPCIETKVADAVVRQLQSDPVIAGNEIRVDTYELVEMILADTLSAPSLAVIPLRTSENRSGATRRARLETELIVGAVTRVPPSRAEGDSYLGRRLLDHVKRVLVREAGVLRDEMGNPISEAQVRFLGPDLTLEIEAAGCLWFPLRVVFTSDIYEATREFVP